MYLFRSFHFDFGSPEEVAGVTFWREKFSDEAGNEADVGSGQKDARVRAGVESVACLDGSRMENSGPRKPLLKRKTQYG
jgi:hypothetical protein